MKSGNKLKSDNHYFRHFNVLPIEQLAKYNVLLEHFDRIKMIPRVQHSHNTRRILTDPAIIPKISNRYGERTYKNIFPRIWNELPDHVKLIEGKLTLKKISKLFYLSQLL